LDAAGAAGAQCVIQEGDLSTLAAPPPTGQQSTCTMR
jgi:hypothetical protein